MAIIKKNYRTVTGLGTLATLITYWCYGGVERFEKLKLANSATSDEGIALVEAKMKKNNGLTPAVVLKMLGYSNEKARLDAKEHGFLPDDDHEFIVHDWVEEIPHIRPATLAEKKKIVAENVMFAHMKDAPDSEIKDMVFDILESVEVVEHNDYTDFMAAYGKENEVETVYGILKQSKYAASFFEGSTDK